MLSNEGINKIAFWVSGYIFIFCVQLLFLGQGFGMFLCPKQSETKIKRQSHFFLAWRSNNSIHRDSYLAACICLSFSTWEGTKTCRIYQKVYRSSLFCPSQGYLWCQIIKITNYCNSYVSHFHQPHHPTLPPNCLQMLTIRNFVFSILAMTSQIITVLNIGGNV